MFFVFTCLLLDIPVDLAPILLGSQPDPARGSLLRATRSSTAECRSVMSSMNSSLARLAFRPDLPDFVNALVAGRSGELGHCLTSPELLKSVVRRSSMRVRKIEFIFVRGTAVNPLFAPQPPPETH